MSFYEFNTFFDILCDVLVEDQEDYRQPVLSLCRHALKIGFEVSVRDKFIVITLPTGSDLLFEMAEEATPDSIDSEVLKLMLNYIEMVEDILGPTLCGHLSLMHKAKSMLRARLN